MCGDLAMIQEVLVLARNELSSHININIQNDFGSTPLHYAIEHNERNIINLLLSQSNIDVNIKDCNGYTPLYYAVEYRKIDIVDALLSNVNIDINIKDRDGNIPLHLAVSNYCSDIVKLLLDHNCDYTLCNNRHQTPKALAIERLYQMERSSPTSPKRIRELEAIIDLFRYYETSPEIKEPDQ
jgi:ankyrin repeat protein